MTRFINGDLVRVSRRDSFDYDHVSGPKHTAYPDHIERGEVGVVIDEDADDPGYDGCGIYVKFFRWPHLRVCVWRSHLERIEP